MDSLELIRGLAQPSPTKIVLVVIDGLGGIDVGTAACCSAEAAAGARRVCQALGIPHDVLDLSRQFQECVVRTFVQEYARGRTPNPCLECNRQIKFRHLLERARALGFRWLATGHYARIRRAEQDGRTVYRLLRGADRRKDQSYVLYMLGQDELPHLLFPLGEMTKEEVRREAERRGLPSARRPESQEICFIPDDDYRRFLAERLAEPAQPGPIRNLAGEVLGTHRGLPYYTIGQRKGLGLSGQPHPLFVVAMDPADNALVVGPEQGLLHPALQAEGVTLVAGGWPVEPLRVEAKVRYRTPAAPATLFPLERGSIRLEFDQAQRAITPGQGLAFYQGDELLGGGTITSWHSNGSMV